MIPKKKTEFKFLTGSVTLHQFDWFFFLLPMHMDANNYPKFRAKKVSRSHYHIPKLHPIIEHLINLNFYPFFFMLTTTRDLGNRPKAQPFMRIRRHAEIPDTSGQEHQPPDNLTRDTGPRSMIESCGQGFLERKSDLTPYISSNASRGSSG